MTYQGVIARTAPQRWSHYAVMGLVFALLGVIPFGLAFSVGGLLETRGGERRGRGFAIVAMYLTVIEIAGLLVWFFFNRAPNG